MPGKRPWDTSEDRVVRFLQKHFGLRTATLKMGIGDDAAVFHPPGADEFWAVTTDILLEDIDFRRGWLTPGQLGHKSLAANLSDLAAMGVQPRYYTVGLGIPGELKQNWIAAFYRGMSRLGDAHGAMLIGGDLSRSTRGLHISIAAFGETLHRRLLYRSGGSPGDLIFVTGTLGLSAAGLKLLELGKTRGESLPERLALKAHREPQPRCETGTWLAQSGLVRCMMDLSDGLSADLPRMCAAGRTGAEIYTELLPSFPECAAWRCDPLTLALHGGEDFELLFAVPARALQAFRAAYPRGFPQVTQIGKLTRKTGVVCRSGPGKPPTPLPALGFDHFRHPASPRKPSNYSAHQSRYLNA
jgi:thiamine-monophosphate kinase